MRGPGEQEGTAGINKIHRHCLLDTSEVNPDKSHLEQTAKICQFALWGARFAQRQSRKHLISVICFLSFPGWCPGTFSASVQSCVCCGRNTYRLCLSSSPCPLKVCLSCPSAEVRTRSPGENPSPEYSQHVFAPAALGTQEEGKWIYQLIEQLR